VAAALSAAAVAASLASTTLAAAANAMLGHFDCHRDGLGRGSGQRSV